jgi:excisionase family DNA binding protein
MDQFLTLAEAGEQIGLSHYTIRGYIRDGRLAAFKPGRRIVLREADLQAFLTARLAPQAPTGAPKAHRRAPVPRPTPAQVIEAARALGERGRRVTRSTIAAALRRETGCSRATAYRAIKDVWVERTAN